MKCMRLPSVIICSTSGFAALARRERGGNPLALDDVGTRLRSVARRCAGWRRVRTIVAMSHKWDLRALRGPRFLRCRWRGLVGSGGQICGHARRTSCPDSGPSWSGFLDLVERFAAEVFGLQHLVLALLDQFADGLDVRVLQAIVRTDGEFEFLDGTIQCSTRGSL